MHYPQYDVGVGVDTLSNAGDGVLSEFIAFLESEGLNDKDEWHITQKLIYHKKRDNQIRAYAVQATAHSNVNISKGKKLIRPLSLFVMDEVQKLYSLNILLNSLSTFLRQMKAGHSKVVLAGNPDRRSMWFDQFYKNTAKELGYIPLRPTYKDIQEWIPDALMDEIQALKRADPVSYAQIYLGDLEVSGWEQTFHSFSTNLHYIPRTRLIEEDNGNIKALIHSIIIGIDDARAHDALVATCITTHMDGRIRIQETLYNSQKEKPVKPALTERLATICEYLDYIQDHFNPNRLYPVYITIDNASDLCTQMQVLKKTDPNYMRWRNTFVFEYTTKQQKETQLDTVNAAFANGVLCVVNVDEFSPQYSNQIMVEQIKDLRYLENGKIDPSIPNDCTDALQYGVMTILSNPYNLSLPKRKERYDNTSTADIYIEKFVRR